MHVLLVYNDTVFEFHFQNGLSLFIYLFIFDIDKTISLRTF